MQAMWAHEPRAGRLKHVAALSLSHVGAGAKDRPAQFRLQPELGRWPCPLAHHVDFGGFQSLEAAATTFDARLPHGTSKPAFSSPPSPLLSIEWVLSGWQGPADLLDPARHFPPLFTHQVSLLGALLTHLDVPLNKPP